YRCVWQVATDVLPGRPAIGRLPQVRGVVTFAVAGEGDVDVVRIRRVDHDRVHPRRWQHADPELLPGDVTTRRGRGVGGLPQFAGVGAGVDRRRRRRGRTRGLGRRDLGNRAVLVGVEGVLVDLPGRYRARQAVRAVRRGRADQRPGVVAGDDTVARARHRGAADVDVVRVGRIQHDRRVRGDPGAG